MLRVVPGGAAAGARSDSDASSRPSPLESATQSTLAGSSTASGSRASRSRWASDRIDEARVQVLGKAKAQQRVALAGAQRGRAEGHDAHSLPVGHAVEHSGTTLVAERRQPELAARFDQALRVAARCGHAAASS